MSRGWHQATCKRALWRRMIMGPRPPSEPRPAQRRRQGQVRQEGDPKTTSARQSEQEEVRSGGRWRNGRPADPTFRRRIHTCCQIRKSHRCPRRVRLRTARLASGVTESKRSGTSRSRGRTDRCHNAVRGKGTKASPCICRGPFESRSRHPQKRKSVGSFEGGGCCSRPSQCDSRDGALSFCGGRIDSSQSVEKSRHSRSGKSSRAFRSRHISQPHAQGIVGFAENETPCRCHASSGCVQHISNRREGKCVACHSGGVAERECGNDASREAGGWFGQPRLGRNHVQFDRRSPRGIARVCRPVLVAYW